MRIAVAGGTGLVGSRTVDVLRQGGDDVVVLSRSAGVDLLTGAGLEPALDGVEAVVDCTSTPARKAEACRVFFGTVAEVLQQGAAAAGARRIVTLSIVGVDQMPGQAHYAGKLAQEAATLAGPVPATILRATQFHDFGGQLIEWLGVGPFVPVPSQPVQTVDVGTVAQHLARLAHEGEPGEVAEVAGPQRQSLPDVVRRTARARGRRAVVVPLWLPGSDARHARRGASLPTDQTTIDGPSFDEWLATVS